MLQKKEIKIFSNKNERFSSNHAHNPLYTHSKVSLYLVELKLCAEYFEVYFVVVAVTIVECIEFIFKSLLYSVI